MLNGNLKWQDVFSFNWSYRWSVNHTFNSNVVDIPNYRLKSYIVHCSEYVNSEYLVNIYIGKDDIMQEILYKLPGKKGSVGFAPMPPKVFHNLFQSKELVCIEDTFWNIRIMKQHNWWYRTLEVVELDGHVLFKFKKKDWISNLRGVRLDTIEYSLVGLMIKTLGPALGFACQHPDTIKSLDDASAIIVSVKDLAMHKPQRDGYYEREIAELRSCMQNTMNDIVKYNQRYDSICADAANAMNDLETNFGIKVNV